MSMRGEIISREYQKMVWVNDNQGKQYACYAEDLKGNPERIGQLTEEEKKNCLDLSTVVGDNW